MRTQINSLFLAALACVAIASASQAETIDVEVRSLAFDPAEVTARPGDVIRWTWVAGTHTVTSGSGCTADGLFDSDIDEDNTSFEWEVPSDASGTIPYFCVPHCAMGMEGVISVDSGAMIRYVGIEAASVSYGDALDPAAVQNVMQITFDGGSADRFAMGFEVEEGIAFLEVSVVGSGVLKHRDLSAGVSVEYAAGTHEIVFAAGAHGLLASGSIDEIDLAWSDTAGSGSSEGELRLGSISGSNGVSIWSTPGGGTETLWVGATNDPDSRVELGLDVIGSSVERTLTWVGAVSGSGFTLPDEASDMNPTTFPVGNSTIVAENAGFFAIVLNDDDGDGDGAGDDGGSCVADLDGNGSVDGADLSILLGSWGVCP